MQSGPQRSPALSPSLIGLPHRLCRYTWCYLTTWGRGRGKAHTRQLSCPQKQMLPPTCATCQESKEHMLPAQPPKLVLGKQAGPTTNTAYGSPGTSDQYLRARLSFSNPQRHHNCPLHFLGCSVVPLPASHEKIWCHLVPGPCDASPSVLWGLESDSPSSNLSNTTYCLWDCGQVTSLLCVSVFLTCKCRW